MYSRHIRLWQVEIDKRGPQSGKEGPLGVANADTRGLLWQVVIVFKDKSDMVVNIERFLGVCLPSLLLDYSQAYS